MPEATVLEDLANDLFQPSLDEGDDLHGAPALGASQGVGLVDALEEDGPALAVESRRLADRRRLDRSLFPGAPPAGGAALDVSAPAA